MRSLPIVKAFIAAYAVMLRIANKNTSIRIADHIALLRS
jgi:hypothetical protein